VNKLPTVEGGNPAAAAQLAQSEARVERLKNPELRSEKELNKATSGFEALLLQQMLKSMWETVDTSGLLGEESNQSQIYRDMFNQAVADTIAEGQGIGVKQFLKTELIRRYQTSKP
jgi:flagellar protein FlgJ